MSKRVNLQQHINGCDKLRALIAQKEEIIAKIDRQRYEKYYWREVDELTELQNALESLMYIIDYPLLRVIVEAIEGYKLDANIAGVIVHYPFRPNVSKDDLFSLLNLCDYGK